MSDNSDGFAFATKPDDATTLTLVEEPQVVRVAVNDFVSPMVGRKRFVARRVEHDRHIHAVIQTPHRIVGVATAVRIGEMIMERQFAVLPLDDAVEVLRVVVELHIGMTIHHALHLLVPDVARAVETNARLELTLESRLLTMREVLVVRNLRVDARPEQFGVLEHPSGLLDAGLDDGLEHASKTSRVEAQHLALERCVFAHIGHPRGLVRGEIEDGGAIAEPLSFDGLCVGEVKQVFHLRRRCGRDTRPRLPAVSETL